MLQSATGQERGKIFRNHLRNHPFGMLESPKTPLNDCLQLQVKTSLASPNSL
jgi:hypothetical protein